MKKYIYILSLLLFSIACKPQNKELQEAQIELEKKVQSIESLLAFMDSSIILTPADHEVNDTLKVSDFRDAFGLKDTLVIEEHINNYLDSIKFVEKLLYPTNYLELDYYGYDFGKKISQSGYYTTPTKEEPIFLLKKVFFKNKTTLAVNDTMVYSPGNSRKGNQIESSKPAAKLAIEVQYQYPIINKVSLGIVNNKISLPEGDIILKKINKNEVTLIMPKMLEERIVDINAIYKDGNVLKKKGMSGNTLPSKKELLFFEKVLVIQKSTLKKLKDNEFKNKKKLDAYIKKNVPNEPTSTQQLFTGTYYFNGNVSSIDLFIKKEQNIFGKRNILIEKNAYRKLEENTYGYYISTDTVSGKDGLVGIDGKWKIQPNFEDLKFKNDYYYSGTYDDNQNQLHHLNLKENKLKPVFYSLDELKIHKGNLIIANTNEGHRKLFGVINAKTGETVIPMKYNYIHIEYGLFTVRNFDNKSGLYDKNGKQILPEIYKSINIFSNKIKTSRSIEGQSNSKYEVFNFKGVQLKE
ncbi:WG repeat-containing protein [Aureibaculum algae]|nr:WG repeat-containing protein [Aureibaculum algae]